MSFFRVPSVSGSPGCRSFGSRLFPDHRRCRFFGSRLLQDNLGCRSSRLRLFDDRRLRRLQPACLAPCDECKIWGAGRNWPPAMRPDYNKEARNQIARPKLNRNANDANCRQTACRDGGTFESLQRASLPETPPRTDIPKHHL